MKLAMMINYSGDFHADVTRVQELEQAGLDLVWVPEAYSFDAISQVGYLAAKTERLEIGTGIINVFSRTATAIAQTAAGCDHVSDGRFVLGLGASGPQVIEGFHGVPVRAPDAAHPRVHRGVPDDVAARARRLRRSRRAHPAAGRSGHGSRQAAEADQPPRSVPTSRSSGPA